MGARRFLNLVYGMLVDRLDPDGRAELDAALDDDETAAATRMIDAVLLAGGEVGT